MSGGRSLSISVEEDLVVDSIDNFCRRWGVDITWGVDGNYTNFRDISVAVPNQ